LEQKIQITNFKDSNQAQIIKIQIFKYVGFLFTIKKLIFLYLLLFEI